MKIVSVDDKHFNVVLKDANGKKIYAKNENPKTNRPAILIETYRGYSVLAIFSRRPPKNQRQKKYKFMHDHLIAVEICKITMQEKNVKGYSWISLEKMRTSRYSNGPIKIAELKPRLNQKTSKNEFIKLTCDEEDVLKKIISDNVPDFVDYSKRIIDIFIDGWSDESII